MAIEFRITVVKNRSGTQAVKVAVSGGIEAATVGEFKQVMEKLVSKGAKNVVLDFSQVTFINSTGLGALLGFSDQFEGLGGGLVLVSVAPKVKTVFDMMGFSPVLKFSPGIAQALMLFQNSQTQASPAPAASKPSPPKAQQPPKPPAQPQTQPRTQAPIKTERVPPPSSVEKAIARADIQQFLRRLGILESPVIHEVSRDTFFKERGIRQLGAGGEGEVHFLRGHVVKVVGPEGVPAALREIAHMLYLNPRKGTDSTVGDRQRDDWPSLIWIYLFSEGGLSIGMRAFDPVSSGKQGMDLRARLSSGPGMGRDYVLFVLRALCNSLAYAHNQGIVHHDFKPENVWLPADAASPPIIFDLGQALWQQGTFGKGWLDHEYNQPFLYNGTYRYMHRLRRYAHLGARDMAVGAKSSDRRRQAVNDFKPTYFDDIFAFGRIVRECVRSNNAELSPVDGKALLAFARRLMSGEPKREKAGTDAGQSKISRRISSIFSGPAADSPVRPAAAIEGRRGTMFQVVKPEFERLLVSLQPIRKQR